ncbi:hypothetical protein JS278_01205 [Acidipropionibacterium virtanenii]|uniref:Uncharacterized protein n=2 Tax=Acidipropionibacterium virtanenii TaxID=2057246 RepID=A0A344USY4_9ACTN|nr:hypothetical protein JS278_01205 [Acidipropionibacterium virtanenii]
MNKAVCAMAALALIPALTGCGDKAADATPTPTVTQQVASPSPAPTAPSPSQSDPIPRLFGHEVHFGGDDYPFTVTSTVRKSGKFTDPLTNALLTGIYARSCVDRTTSGSDLDQGLGWWRWTAIEANGTQRDGANSKIDLPSQRMYPFTQSVAPAAGQCFEGWVLFDGAFTVSQVAQFGELGWRSN